MNNAALIVFGKNPVPGTVKTRLGARIGAVTAAALYEAFLIDTLQRSLRLEVPIRLYLSHTDEAVSPAVAAFDGMHLRQRGEGLGDRMRNAFEETFDAGHRPVIVIGSDHPTLPVSRIGEAFELLRTPGTVALGPSRDGGYYLLGLSEPCPLLFERMTYSHEKVLEETLSRAQAAGLRAVSIEPWYDVDTIDDLRRLAAELKLSVDDCPNTRAVLMHSDLLD